MSRPAATATTAAALALLSCHVCGLLSRQASAMHANRCPRCGAHLEFRKPNSMPRTWALLLSAMILYIPANLLPMMKTSSLFGSDSDTIMSGVVYFWVSGSWHLALIIFFASIMVPLVKMLALVQLKALATIEPGPGAIAFGAVVVLTMFSSMAFDPRLIWDPLEKMDG